MNTKISFLTIALLFLLIQQSISKENNSVIISKSVNSLNISIDVHDELISIVQYLGGYFRLNKFELEYKSSIDKYFEKYKEYEAV